MQIHLLGSGSSGNCALVTAGSGGERVSVVLDCGLAQRTARGFAESAGHALTRIDAVLLSHHHGDHSANVVGVAARAGVPLHFHPEAAERSPRTCARERRRRRIAERPFASGECWSIGCLKVTAVPVPHDAEPTHGFLFEADGQRAGFFTDLGHTDPLEEILLEGLDALVLEFNHDPEMLRNGPYPRPLQDRVGGELGHLSNAQAAELLAGRGPRTLRHLVLAHLSEKNNRPALALEAAGRALAARGISGVEPRVAPKSGLIPLYPEQQAGRT